jgi:tRNA(Ile)-lysidine synthase
VPGEAAAVLDAARATGLLPPGEPVVVLLSGGRDSVCLLDVAATLAGRDAVTALHVNYGLRDSSDDDDRHCRALCAALGIPVDVVRAERSPESGNLQAWAREVRYEVAERAAATRDARVAAGHTSSDQAETILYRLASSPSRRALLGMPAQEGRLVRPLLGVSREQTAAYCRERHLAWREDASNESDAFARNRLRAGLLPALRDVHPAAEQNVVRVATILREEAAVLDEAVAALIDGRDEVSLDALRAAPPALARLAVTRLAESALGRLVPSVGARVGDILALGDGAALDLGSGSRARVERGMLRFEPTPRLPA